MGDEREGDGTPEWQQELKVFIVEACAVTVFLVHRNPKDPYLRPLSVLGGSLAVALLLFLLGRFVEWAIDTKASSGRSFTFQDLAHHSDDPHHARRRHEHDHFQKHGDANSLEHRAADVVKGGATAGGGVLIALVSYFNRGIYQMAPFLFFWPIVLALLAGTVVWTTKKHKVHTARFYKHAAPSKTH